jgi:hypothetical protein
LRPPFVFVLFDPDRFFGAVAGALRPFRRLLWLLIPFTFFACLIIVHNFTAYTSALAAAAAQPKFWAMLFFAELTLNLSVRIAQGIVIRGWHAPVREFWVRLAFGWWPRFHVDDSAVPALPRQARLWFYGSTLLTRLAAFAAGTTLWGVYWRSHGALADVGLILGQIGLLSFAICAFPLFALDGSKWLASALDQPQLLPRAMRFVRMRLEGRAAPDAMSTGERWGLALFAIGTVITAGIAVVWFIAGLFAAVVDRFEGVGFVLVLLQFAVAVPYILTVARTARRRDEVQRAAQVSAARRLMASYSDATPLN